MQMYRGAFYNMSLFNVNIGSLILQIRFVLGWSLFEDFFLRLSRNPNRSNKLQLPICKFMQPLSRVVSYQFLCGATVNTFI